MIDNESSYLSSLNNFILTLGVIIAFYEYFIRGKKFINSKISYTILALLIAFNLFLIASVIQFHRRMNFREPEHRHARTFVLDRSTSLTV